MSKKCADNVVNSLGVVVAKCNRDWQDITMYMDPEIAESLYCQEHEQKYNEPFIWDTENA